MKYYTQNRHLNFTFRFVIFYINNFENFKIILNSNIITHYIKNRLIELESEKQNLIKELNELRKKQITPLYGNQIRKSIPKNKNDKFILFEFHME